MREEEEGRGRQSKRVRPRVSHAQGREGGRGERRKRNQCSRRQNGSDQARKATHARTHTHADRHRRRQVNKDADADADRTQTKIDRNEQP